MRFLFPVLLVCSLYTGVAAYAEDDSDVFSGFNYTGTLGETHIGLTLLEQNDKLVSPSHYYYFKYMTDISLTPEQGENVSLTGSDGGVFHLKFKGNADTAGEPLTVENSTGLVGTWTSKEGKSFPVALDLQGGYQKDAANDRQYANLTDKSDADYESKAQAFYKAVMAGNRADAAKYVHFPLRYNAASGKAISIKNPDMLNQHWDAMFNAAWLKAAAEAVPHDMNAMDGYAYIGAGLVYFDDEGAVSINAAQ